MSDWINFVKSWTKHHNISYKDALKDKKCKLAYHSSKSKEGSGFIDDMKNKVIKLKNALIHGRDDYPPKIREFLNNYGNDAIVSATIRRVPIQNNIMKALNYISLGSFGNRLERSDYDKLFHLQFIITTDKGHHVQIEKEEVIKFVMNPQPRENEEYSPVTIPERITIQELMDNTKDDLGDSMFSYSAKDNNCQDFVMGILDGNNIGSNENRKFVKQDTDDLFANDNFLRKFSNTVTDIGSRVNVLQEGAGFRRK